jgi:hypothetical protein
VTATGDVCGVATAGVGITSVCITVTAAMGVSVTEANRAETTDVSEAPAVRGVVSERMT